MGKFGFTDSTLCILKLGSPVGSRLILDTYYVAISLVSRSAHIWAAFVHVADHSALVCHRFIEADCVLTGSGLNKACITINF